MKEFQRLNNDTMVHSKETIPISSDDNESVTDIEEEDFYDNDITQHSRPLKTSYFAVQKNRSFLIS